MKLLNYIFFTDNKKVKDSFDISRSILEVVRSSLNEETQINNYKFFLFYLSLASLIDPNLYEIYYYSAQIYQSLENYKKAEYFYKKIKNGHILYLESQKNIAINKRGLGLFDEAERGLLNLINLNKKNINLNIALADLYRVEKKYDESIFHYTKIINSYEESNPELWRIIYYRGICFERVEKWDLAEKDFLLSLKIKPNSPQVLNYLAYGWLERDQNLKLAMEMLQKAYNTNQESYYILDSLAWAYYKQNNLFKALELMEEVINKAPGEAISLDHLADIYFAMKRKREAIFFWKQALDLATPEDKIIESVKRKLKKYNAR